MEYLFLLDQLFDIATTPISVYNSNDQCVLELATPNKLIKTQEFRQKINAKLLSQNPLCFTKVAEEPIVDYPEVAAILLPDDNIVYIEATANLSIDLRRALNCAIEIIYWSLVRIINKNTSLNRLVELFKTKNAQDNSKDVNFLSLDNVSQKLLKSKLQQDKLFPDQKLGRDLTLNKSKANNSEFIPALSRLLPEYQSTPQIEPNSCSKEEHVQEATSLKDTSFNLYNPDTINNLKSCLTPALIQYICNAEYSDWFQHSYYLDQELVWNNSETLVPIESNNQKQGLNLEIEHNPNLPQKHNQPTIFAEQDYDDFVEGKSENSEDFDGKYNEQYLEKIKAKFKHDYSNVEKQHNSYAYELSIFEAVQVGDVERALRAFDRPEKKNVGRMGSTSLQHYKTMVVVEATLASRAVIRGGMPVEKAFSLADHWLFECELCNDPVRLEEMVREIVIFFSIQQKIHLAGTKFTKNKTVLNAIEFIERHIFDDLKVKVIAEQLGISPDHLQRLFKQELGVNVSDMIMEKKIKNAQDLICNTDLKFTEISTLLNFCSPSYFNQCFKKITHISPREYKKNSTILQRLKS